MKGIDIIDKIGMPAMLEQLAEECAELGQAALKMARIDRGENPTRKRTVEAVNDLHSEIADVMLCIELILEKDILDDNLIATIMATKQTRWEKALDEYSKEDK